MSRKSTHFLILSPSLCASLPPPLRSFMLECLWFFFPLVGDFSGEEEASSRCCCFCSSSSLANVVRRRKIDAFVSAYTGSAGLSVPSLMRNRSTLASELS